MNKLIRSAIVMGAVLVGINSFAFAKFDDMQNAEANYTKAIDELIEKGVINGYPDNTFRPDGKMTRAEFAKIIVTAEKLSETLKENKFTDISNHWAEEYISIMAANGMIQGYEDNTFKPNNEITYAEVVAILIRELDMEDKLDETLQWPQNYMSLASEVGIFDGFATNDLVGNNPARRDNVALMVWNKMQIELENENNEAEKEEQENQEQENQEETDKINTRENHVGFVTKMTFRRGETYITVKDTDGNEEDIKIYSDTTVPKIDSFIVYTLTSKGEMKLKKQLLVADIDDVSMIVEDVDGELVKIKDEEKWLDFELDSYTYGSEEIKWNKYTYYVVEMNELTEGVFKFDTIDQIEKEDIHFKKDDRICVDSDTKIALIIRSLGE